MNLIYIYFSKRVGGGYWRGALVRRNMVREEHSRNPKCNTGLIIVLHHSFKPEYPVHHYPEKLVNRFDKLFSYKVRKIRMDMNLLQ